jgi:hypothetical protein
VGWMGFCGGPLAHFRTTFGACLSQRRRNRGSLRWWLPCN